MTVYVIARYERKMVLTNLDVFYESRYAREKHDQLRSNQGPDELYMLNCLDDLDQMKDIPRVKEGSQ